MAINQEPNIHELVVCANIFVRKDGRYLLLKRSPKKKFAPNVIHPIGGKLDNNENPFIGSQRELLEEAGIKVKSLKLEAVILEISPHKKEMENNWLIFHFSGDYDSGELIKTEEGEFVWLEPEEIAKQDLFPSVEQVIGNILNPSDGTVFATFEYDDNGKIIERTKKIDKCALL
ncbi:MAG: NUDIX domain-containing protein [Candidatus Pacebacteria bacterium]|nr:NUDIX domain-containing protein [Candidatus Paceibacterota bacterium]